MNNNDLTLEKLQKSIQEYFEENPESKNTFSELFIIQNRNKTRYSYWKICDVITGNKGKEMFDKALYEAGKKYLVE